MSAAHWFCAPSLPRLVPETQLSPKARWRQRMKRLRCKHERRNWSRSGPVRAFRYHATKALVTGMVVDFIGFTFIKTALITETNCIATPSP